MTRHLPMVSRFTIGLAAYFAAPISLHAQNAQAPAAIAPASVAKSVTYLVNNQAGSITVTDGGGKTLFSRRSTTPTVIVVLTKGPDKALQTFQAAATNASTLPRYVTLQDANGVRLWSVQVPIVPPLTAQMHTGSLLHGTEFVFTQNTETAPDPNIPTLTRAAFYIGPQGTPTSINEDGKITIMTSSPQGIVMNTPQGKIEVKASTHGFTLSGPDGQALNMAVNKGGKGGTFNLNGTKIPFTEVTRDGKEYATFPWNGHPVFVEAGCTFNFNSNGELIVNAPAKGK